MIRRFGFTLLALGFAALSLTAQPAKTATPKVEKKTYELTDKDLKKEMEFALFVPSTYDKTKKSPLIVALHGLGGNPQQFMKTRGLTDLAEKYGYIVVAPMGYNTGGWYGARNPLPANKDDPKNLSELSEKDVMNVLEIVRKEYSIDPDRTYLMGHSMGGGGTWHLGIKNPEIWAGLAPIAPAVFRQASDVEKVKAIPVILVQGDKDTLCPVAKARQWAEQMKKLEMTYEYIEVKDGTHGSVVAENMPKIFEFFNKHKRGEKKTEEKEKKE